MPQVAVHPMVPTSKAHALRIYIPTTELEKGVTANYKCQFDLQHSK